VAENSAPKVIASRAISGRSIDAPPETAQTLSASVLVQNFIVGTAVQSSTVRF